MNISVCARLALAWVLTGASIGCTSDRGSGGQPDPGESEVAASGQVRIDTAVVHVIGGEGSTTIGVVAAGLLLPGDGVLLADRVDDNLVLIAGTGHQPVRVGRKGSGPGEFRQLSWIGHCGKNSVAAWDARQQMLSTFDLTARFMGSRAVTGGIWMLDCAEDGTVAASYAPATDAGMPAADAKPFSYDIALLVSDTSIKRRALATGVGVNRPLGKATIFRADRGSVVHGMTSEAFLIRTTTENGPAVDTIALGLAPLTIDSTIYAAAIEHQLSALLNAEAREQFRTVLARIPPPESPPVFRDFRISPSGHLWVTASLRGSGQTRLVVFDSQGIRQGEVVLRGEAELLDVSGDRFMILRDDSGIGQSVMIYRYSMVP